MSHNHFATSALTQHNATSSHHLLRSLTNLFRTAPSPDQEPSNLPSALPCPDFYARHPDRVGCVANVVLHSEEDLLPWLLVARPVTRAEAEERGGCLIFSPLPRDAATSTSSTTTTTAAKMNGRDSCSEVQYYCITDSDDEVYGRAAYLPLPVAVQMICLDDPRHFAFSEEEEEEEEDVEVDECYADSSSEPAFDEEEPGCGEEMVYGAKKPFLRG